MPNLAFHVTGQPGHPSNEPETSIPARTDVIKAPDTPRQNHVKSRCEPVDAREQWIAAFMNITQRTSSPGNQYAKKYAR